jgi:hypothetical protein
MLKLWQPDWYGSTHGEHSVAIATERLLDDELTSPARVKE